MTATPITVNEEVSITEAQMLMKRNRIRRLPVMKENKLVGIVTDRDVLSAAPSQVLSFDEKERELMPELYELMTKIKLKDIMSRSLRTISADDSVITAAQLLLTHKISGLPVLSKQGLLIGIITEGDLFKALVDFSGLNMGKTIFGFLLPDQSGNIKEVADIIRAHGGRMASIMTSMTNKDGGERQVIIRIADQPVIDLDAMQKDLEEKFTMLFRVEDRIE
jgi:acetoin utilization protein AcuB